MPFPPLAANAVALLDLLREPAHAATLSAREWDLLVRSARTARLLGVLEVRLTAAGVLPLLPLPVREHLAAAGRVAAYRRRMALYAVDRIAAILVPAGIPLVLLKGTAYAAQGAACADGRVFEDVDLMIPRPRLAEAEARLLAAGWAYDETLSPYDDRYYREWSHELPPLRNAEHPLELDLHHAILPPTGRAQPVSDALFADALPIAGSGLLALAPVDQVLHVCAQVFQDSDCVGRLRDLVDLDALLRTHGGEAGFWPALARRADRHGLARALWYGLRYCSSWLGTPAPANATAAVLHAAPGRATARVMDALLLRALIPGDPDREPGVGARIAGVFLAARAVWLRMPPWLFLYHAVHKGYRAMAGGVRPKSGISSR